MIFYDGYYHIISPWDFLNISQVDSLWSLTLRPRLDDATRGAFGAAGADNFSMEKRGKNWETLPSGKLT